MTIKPRSALEKISPYVPGKSAEDFGGDVEVIKLSSNENPFGPSIRVQEALVQEMAQTQLYPDGSGRMLRTELGQKLGVSPDNIILGCGADEVIRLLGEAYLEPGVGCMFADATFSQYVFVARLMGAKEIVVPLADGVHDLDAMAEVMERERPRLCFVCNPNNPTGTYVTREQLERFLDRVPPQTLVVLDEAYFEYADAPDFPDGIDYVRANRPVVVLRTFSKIHSLAGLRVGYGVAPAEVVSDLHRIRPPFNVNRLAQAAAIAALRDDNHVQKSRDMNAKERIRLMESLRAMGLSVLPSQANFLFVEFDANGTEIYEALSAQGVIVRDGTPFSRPKAIRVTIGTPRQNDVFLRVLQEVLTRMGERGINRA